MVRNWMGRVGERAGSIQEGGMERGRGSVTTGASFRRHVLQDRKRKPHNWCVECTSKQVWSSGYDVSLTR
jgi:hypothetical protein